MRILCERGLNSPEIRAVKMHCLMQSPAYEVRSEETPSLHTLHLESFDLIVGSVEFLRHAFLLLGVAEPVNLSYCEKLKPFLGRSVEVISCADSLREAEQRKPVFIKPVQIKAFTGFVFRGLSYDYDEHDQEQLVQFLEHKGDVWIAPEISFLCEWRYYIQGAKIIGQGRYDPDGADEAPEPDRKVIEQAISAFESSPAAYTLDFGVTNFGQTVLIEANDAWAIGLYGKSLSAKAYFGFLLCRFQEIKKS